MPNTAFTYGTLDKRLRVLGFTAHTQQGKARIYRHEQTGASLILPDAPFEGEVLPHHLVVARRVLREHDLGDLAQGQTSAMPDREKDELAWRAFYLGLRLAFATRGADIPTEELPSLVGPLYAIAGSNSTAHDSTAVAPGITGPTGECVISIGKEIIKADRELAGMVVRGFAAAMDVKDDGEAPEATAKRPQGVLHGTGD